MNEKPLSEEFIHAFADDQLAPEEKSRAYPIVNGDPELNRQVCEVRKIRDLIQLAYREPPGRDRHAHRVPHSPFSIRFNRFAAVLLVVLGVGMGWVMHYALVRDSHENTATTPTGAVGVVKDQTVALPTQLQKRIAPVAVAGDGEVKVVLHLTRGSVAAMQEVLDDAESLINFYAQTGQPARIEVITNGEGLSLLRSDISPFVARIHDMQHRYSNLTFAACQNTIDRLKREQGIVARLVPDAIVVDSGVAQVILLQQEGWAYIQV